MLKKICNGLFLIVFSLSFYSTAVSAGDSSGTSDWEFNLAPFYLWAVNIDGDITTGQTVPVEVKFGDIFDSLEAAFIVHFETLYKAQWGFLVDVNYLDLENKANLLMGIGPNVDLTMTMAEFSGFYRLQRDTHAFDFIAGLRYLDVENTVSIIGGLTLMDASKDWLDPLVGARWIWGFADGWSFIARGDIGGFGIGSEFSWHAIGVVEWQPWKHASFLAGYRALDVDYEDGSGKDYFNFDATIHGPVLGLNFKW